jgi:hypothetical protein
MSGINSAWWRGRSVSSAALSGEDVALLKPHDERLVKIYVHLRGTGPASVA